MSFERSELENTLRNWLEIKKGEADGLSMTAGAVPKEYIRGIRATLVDLTYFLDYLESLEAKSPEPLGPNPSGL